MSKTTDNRVGNRKREATRPQSAVSRRADRANQMTNQQATQEVSTETMLREVLKKLNGLDAKVNGLDAKANRLDTNLEALRDFQIDQERERHTLLLSGSIAGRGALPSREQNLTISGARFKATKKDRKPASIY